MRRLVLGTVSALAISIFTLGAATAADLPVKAPVYKAPPAPVYLWSGFYVGLNAGGTWSGDNSVDTVSSPVQNFVLGPGNWAAASAAGATGNVHVGDSAGFIGGAQIGYNWQFSPAWVAGLEADIQGVSHNNNGGTLNTTVGPFPFFGEPEILTTQITSSKQLDYLGTVRGRIGYLATPELLVYGTGGLAYGGVKASTLITQSNNNCALSPLTCIQSSASTAGSFSETRVGWTAGAGLEWMFWQRWSAKVEYLYYDLGRVTFNDGNLVFNSGTLPAAGGPAIIAASSSTKFNGNIVRVGVNYHF